MRIFKNFPLSLVVVLALPACVRGPAAADTEGASSSTGGSSTTTMEMASGTLGAPGMCAPEPDDGACLTCIKSKCCDQKQACEANEDCSCLLTCLSRGGSLCAHCTASPADVPAIGALLMCLGPNCGAQCG